MVEYGLHKNSEGYNDPTAHDAMTKVMREERELQQRVNITISIIKSILDLAGFELIARIALKDRKTGREYR